MDAKSEWEYLKQEVGGWPTGNHGGKRRKMEASGVCKQLEMLSCSSLFS